MGKRYDKEFKIEAVQLASEPGNTQAQIEQYLSFADITIQKHADKNRTLIFLNN